MEVSEEYKKNHPFKFKEKEKLYWIRTFEDDPEYNEVCRVECFYKTHKWGNDSKENSYLCCIVATPDDPDYIKNNSDDYAIYPTNEYYINESSLTRSASKAVKELLKIERKRVLEVVEEYNGKKKLLQDFVRREEPNSVRFINEET